MSNTCHASDPEHDSPVRQACPLTWMVQQTRSYPQAHRDSDPQSSDYEYHLSSVSLRVLSASLASRRGAKAKARVNFFILARSNTGHSTPLAACCDPDTGRPAACLWQLSMKPPHRQASSPPARSSDASGGATRTWPQGSAKLGMDILYFDFKLHILHI